MDQQDLVKNISALIDETLVELEDLKKSKMTAVETQIAGPGEGIAGQPSNGELDAGKVAQEKKEKEEKEKKEKEAKEKEAKEKAEPMAKSDDEDEDDKDDKKEDKKKDKKDEKKEPEKKDEDDKEDKMKPFKKSLEDHEALFKSFDNRFETLEKKFDSLMSAVNKLADAPMPSRGVPSGVVPLKKSEDVKVLSKSEVTEKLLTLKKSGTQVSTDDIISAECGGDLKAIVDKYNLK